VLPVDDDALRLDVLGEQVLLVPLGRGEMQRRESRRQRPVDLLGEGRVRVARAEPGLEVHDGDLLVEGGQAADKGRRGVALHEHRVGALGLEERCQAVKRARRHRRERLPRRAQVEVVVRDDPEQVEDLGEHLSVLARHDDDRVEVGRPLELRDHGGDLDPFRTGAKDHHYAAAFHPPMPLDDLAPDLAERAQDDPGEHHADAARQIDAQCSARERQGLRRYVRPEHRSRRQLRVGDHDRSAQNPSRCCYALSCPVPFSPDVSDVYSSL